MAQCRETKCLPGLGTGKEKWREGDSDAWLAMKVTGEEKLNTPSSPRLAMCWMGLQEELGTEFCVDVFMAVMIEHGAAEQADISAWSQKDLSLR